ncbi:tRNA (adenosine(37)-N6)-dimethylallyltransferase MiaA [Taibaiella helva]|uniref:tRNA (adenosine(37)-N6)-dimethylallyltransferase MiaA n=1 Tax=Taibaiella helva TaxID=2301235 RepID=UPI000E585E2D|nr:tRNA (adenosine(37)-N6)-dimethylallyltransferase MiaA [Taibaiella helva]
MAQKQLVIIAGPTAVGKTNIAIRVAEHFGTEIISADSRQCYREMSIGTAKPTKEEQARVKHYFIDSHSVAEELNAADYEQLALGYCAAIFEDKDVAVVCGGTGLYIRALCEGIDSMPATDRVIEQALQQEYEQKGIGWLQQVTAAEDPEFFAIAEQQNPARLIRALAFRRSTGSSIVHYRSGTIKERPFGILKIALELPRQELYHRIDRRVDQMMIDGLWEEAETLYPMRRLKNLQTVGYSELFDCFDGRISKSEAIALIKQHSRNYAKRQLTWFRKDKDYHWYSPWESEALLAFISKALEAHES